MTGRVWRGSVHLFTVYGLFHQASTKQRNTETENHRGTMRERKTRGRTQAHVLIKNTHVHKTQTHSVRPLRSTVACSSTAETDNNGNGHTVETGHDGVLTAVPRVVVRTPEGNGTNTERGRGGGRGLETGQGGEELKQEETHEKTIKG